MIIIVVVVKIIVVVVAAAVEVEVEVKVLLTPKWRIASVYGLCAESRCAKGDKKNELELSGTPGFQANE